MKDLSATGALPGIQAILEWKLGAEVSRAIGAASVIDEALGRGLQRSDVANMFAKTESPAERQFLLGVLLDPLVELRDKDSGSSFIVVRYASRDFGLYNQEEVCDWNRQCQQCSPDVECKHDVQTVARLDFMLRAYTVPTPDGVQFSVTAGIEVDGHDFHERTKEQVRKDKARDRSVLALDPMSGYAVADVDMLLRFSASEVFTAPVEVANEAIRMIHTRLLSFEGCLKHVYRAAYSAGYRQRGYAIIPAQEAAE